MSFSRDIRHERDRAPRTLNEAFGPYAKLHVKERRTAQGWLWAIGYGIAVGVFLWVVVLVKVGPR